ncbi:hypothetical protein EXIGLDRAFT_839577 [Exidia glandulosa HHB12029]|uniref:Uncharacterized protein n=1 Tax=Exidia glandulosa HHB12029 TaxID=1314781 RepID=A0A165EYS9_EXIGL|nr:hypothetical protein EXIGLDRAFT_839577 [Exidia glandulosa HHB12029]
MSTRTARPILRNAPSSASSVSSSSSATHAARRVHFPPPPSLMSIHPALPASAYDRSAIVVQANPCALPPRGSRVYALPEPHPSKRVQTPYARQTNPFDDAQEDEPTTDESDATPTPTPISSSLAAKRVVASSKPSRPPASFFSPYADMACLNGF